MSADVWFDGWPVILRTLLVGVAAYAVLVALVRTSGKRTLAQLNAFDLLVTVALGSTLASVLVSNNVAFAQGVTAFLVLAGLQFAITWLSVRSGVVRRLVKSEPTLLAFRGELLRDAMRRQRVTEDEVRSAVRAQRFASLDDVEAVVLETNGTVSVLRRPGHPVDPGRSSLQGVNGLPPER